MARPEMKKLRTGKWTTTFALFLIVITACAAPAGTQSFSGANAKNVKSSEVAGTEFYSEKISVTVSGPYSTIKQSMATDDSNIFQEIDFKDPAFYGSSFFMIATNGKSSPADPQYSPDSVEKDSSLTSNSFIGFLYYEDSLSKKQVAWKSERAIKILKESFGMDVLPVNFTENNNSHFLPFMGFYPNWDRYLYTTLTDLPDDGYWNATDKERLMSKEYYQEKMLKSTLLYLNTPETLDEIKNVSSMFGDYIEYMVQDTGLLDMNSTITSLMGMGEMMGDLVSQLNDTMGLGEELYSALFNMTVTEVDSMIQSIEDISGTDISTVPDNLVVFTIEYEGDPAGVTEVSPGYYTFDLRKALNYEGDVIQASKKIYLALIGALFSGIDFTVLSGNVVWNNPNIFELSSYLLDRIELLAFYSGEDVDLSMLYDYNIRGAWEARGQTSQFWCNLHEKEVANDQFDFADYLYILGFQGFPEIPLGLLEGISNFQFGYNITDLEPILEVKKYVDVAVADPQSRNINWRIVVRNIGPVPAFGIVPDAPPQDLPREMADLLEVAGFGQIAIPSWRDAINAMPPDLLQSLLDYFGYDTVEELTGTNNSRVFMLDQNSDGVMDAYEPNVNDPTLDVPYNPEVADWMRSDEAVQVTGQPKEVLLLWAALFDNPNSIYNPDNWRLDPGEEFMFTGTSSVAAFDTYEPFYSENQSVDELFPYLVYGKNAQGTNGTASVVNDNQSWYIDTERVGDQNLIQVIFQFQNNSLIDTSKTIDLLEFEYSGYNNITFGAAGSSWAVWDWNQSQFVNFNWNTDMTEKNSSNAYFVNSGGDFINEQDNYTVYLQMTIDADNFTRVAIDGLNMSLVQRGVHGVPLGPATFIFSSGYGLNRYHQKSNDILAGTNNLPSLIVQSDVNVTNCHPGDLVEYSLVVSNNGSRQAKNVSISIPVPGIIQDPGNFSVVGNYMVKNITEINASGLVSNLKFTFKVPNSILIPGTTVMWDHEWNIDEGHYDYNTTG
ncbi:MAG: hypothetical protein ACTSU5_14270, partial [Promethearchaeota archaeon]